MPLFKPSLPSLTLSQFISNERAVCSILSFRLGDHHGGERGDEAILQGHVQGLGCGIGFLVRGANLAARMKKYTQVLTLDIFMRPLVNKDI